jgi:hypothetical protein
MAFLAIYNKHKLKLAICIISINILINIKPLLLFIIYYYIKTNIKKMKTKIIGGLLIAVLAITSVAQAQTKTPVITRREHRQERRINQGVRSGELTRNETHHLRKGESHIRNEKRMAMANGNMTHAKRRTLRHQENRMSRAIYRDKHNDKLRG